jgi:hypothetical protein
MTTVKAKIIMITITATVFILVNPVYAVAPNYTKMPYTIFQPIFTPKSYALQVIKNKGWSKHQFDCLNYIWTRESNWNPRAKNPTSTAFGIGQLLTEKSPNAALQIRNGIRYIGTRYGTPCNAKQFWQRHYWY